METAKLLIVEDEEAIASGMAFNFRQEGYDVTVATDGQSAVRYYEQRDTPFDLIILDLMLPGMSGYDVCREVRKKDIHVPIIVLSARALSEDRTMAFDAGTDQYLSKPFALPELLARVRNLLERHRAAEAASTRQHNTANFYEFANVTVDFDQFKVIVDGENDNEQHELTTLEAQLLKYFIKHQGRVLSRIEIIDHVWPPDSDVTPRTVDNFVMRLRKMFESDPANPTYLLSVRGTGYKFLPPSDSATA
ncbi:response regulator transcription factor [Calycomorphotria hydatis]|uniref:Sensory transduction protein regX3 n=1 Tax=Calycomorphotria hydatis TaxID=2528027 RepID=A0A517TER8_9PLAN|nr:response regulator transcription factor [Calycomorphotria hydatis]QDT66859.1 Sensory transduction protein regX3 [Calycomorphotria hydatis]